ncbi:3-oxoacid CoA-transferase subunit A [Enterococcus wangshanyuanii]|uniref:Acetate CoA-transferase subunit alpha n=1 Tax=Enterococcus wangshanyuanii TaxID=2005703 RepID=A0ABQ1P535_9ENTE|nr:3-oxoacid CoA-transferase subunit A [Enterococcus wangshanyuanii]GGC89078.1 acetate CoA-transferase subunit alpha [Enterococcus wangshanyuanii]
MKRIDKKELMNLIHTGETVMIGGFMSVGIPETAIQVLAQSEVENLTIISNDTGVSVGEDKSRLGIGRLLLEHKVRKVIASHIGMNAETGRQMINEEIEVELVPQGTLAEKIHAGGAGLGGFLTPTGLGTVVAQGKEILSIADKEYLLETPLIADVALIKAHKADTLGNLVYQKAARNFNPVMALAAKTVIVEVDELVEAGALDPEEIVTPFVVVDKILVKEKSDAVER